MRNSENKALYESIMREVAKVVKRRINEDFLPSNFDENDLISYDDAYDIAQEDENYRFIKPGMDYIRKNPSLMSYYKTCHIQNIVPSDKVSTICTDGKKIYYSIKFMKSLSAKEQAFVIMHNGVHILMSHKASNFEENVELDRTVNAYIENHWPEFRGMTKRLNGYI